MSNERPAAIACSSAYDRPSAREAGNNIDNAECAYWRAEAGTAVPAEAWVEYRRAEVARIQRPATVKQDPA